MTGPESARSHRRGVAAILVLLGAAGTAGSAFLPWWRRDYHDPLSGGLTIAVDGGAIAAGLVPLALVAIAALAAAMISRGPVRRILGAVAALAAAGAAALALQAATHTPDAEFAARLVRPATPLSPAEMVWGAVILAIAGAIVGTVGGIMVALAGDRRDRPGRSVGLAYRPPAAQRDAVRQAARRPRTVPSARQHGAATQTTAQAESAGQDAPAGQHAAGPQQGTTPQPGPATDAAPGPSAPATDPADSGDWWRSLDAGVDPTDDARGA